MEVMDTQTMFRLRLYHRFRGCSKPLSFWDGSIKLHTLVTSNKYNGRFSRWKSIYFAIRNNFMNGICGLFVMNFVLSTSLVFIAQMGVYCYTVEANSAVKYSSSLRFHKVIVNSDPLLEYS